MACKSVWTHEDYRLFDSKKEDYLDRIIGFKHINCQLNLVEITKISAEKHFK